jgi:hypothetical protein
MKNNWGTYIAITYTLFASIMIFMLLKSCGISTPLIDDNYYNKELQFKSLKTFKQNAIAANMIPVVVEDNTYLIWQFDSTMQVNSGTVTYKHLKEPNYDKELEFNLDNQRQIKRKKIDFNKGTYQVEMFWENKVDTFYYKVQIDI